MPIRYAFAYLKGPESLHATAGMAALVAQHLEHLVRVGQHDGLTPRTLALTGDANLIEIAILLSHKRIVIVGIVGLEDRHAVVLRELFTDERNGRKETAEDGHARHFLEGWVI